MRKGSALHGQRDYEASIAAYKAGLEVEPESALLKKGLAEVEKAAEKDDIGGAGDGIGKLFKDPNVSSQAEGNSCSVKVADIVPSLLMPKPDVRQGEQTTWDAIRAHVPLFL